MRTSNLGFLILLVALTVWTVYFFRNEIVAFSEGLYLSYTKENYLLVGIDAQPQEISTDTLNVRLSLNYLGRIPAEEVFVSVYEERTGVGVYEYSILRTDTNGFVDLILKKGDYDIVLATSPRVGISSFHDKYFFVHDTVHLSGVRNEKRFIRLSSAVIYLSDFPFTIPEMKLEATSKTKSGRIPSHNFGLKQIGEDKVEVLFSGKEVCVNFDQETFDEDNILTFALGVPDLVANNVYKISYTKLSHFSVMMEGVTAGWFKLFDDNRYGDFQSKSYFGKSTHIYSNLDNLNVYMAYVPLAECIDSLIQTQSYRVDGILNFCSDSDVRYDFAPIPLIKDGLVILDPPTKILLWSKQNRISQGGFLDIAYEISTGRGNVVSGAYVHQLWDKKIMPKFFVINDLNQVVQEMDSFDIGGESSGRWALHRRICVPPGSYTIKGMFLAGTWGREYLENSLNLIVDPGNSCSAEEEDTYPIVTKETSSWQELYTGREKLFSNSSGYSMTFPNYPKADNILLDSHKEVVQSCSDFDLLHDQTTIIVRLNDDLVNDLKKEQVFSSCLKKYVLSHPGRTYILNGNFFRDRVFPTVNIYVYYYYYLVIKQSGDSSVGVHATQFYDLLFGFPDFYVIDGKSNYWLDGYAGVVFNQNNLNNILSNNYGELAVRIFDYGILDKYKVKQ